jgi:1,4-dihydroxy-6-naphthoate synthase
MSTPLSSSPKTGITPEPAIDLKLAHSPDSDDAFMFYALATRKIPTREFSLTHVLEDIESLNQKAQSEVYDITAVSFHAYAYLADKYVLLPSGASFGDRYGPIVVSRTATAAEGLKGKRIAVPGKMTTAFLALKLYEPDFEPVVTPFDQILEAVVRGDADAGVVIHEGQLTYWSSGLQKVVDLGEWWYQETQLPLPLGGNVIRRALDDETKVSAAKLLSESIRYSLEHRDEALAYALQFSRGLDTSTADRFVSMYVNELTVDYGATGRRAVQTLLDRGFEKGLLPRQVTAEYISTAESQV